MQFPAMRRLSIATAHAFLLVYATTSAPSFQSVRQCFDEIREQRADFQVSHLLYGNSYSSAWERDCKIQLEQMTHTNWKRKETFLGGSSSSSSIYWRIFLLAGRWATDATDGRRHLVMMMQRHSDITRHIQWLAGTSLGINSAIQRNGTAQGNRAESSAMY